MCFSATASLTSAALLGTTGMVTTIFNRSKEYTMIAAIPLFFGIQQAAEGVVWTGIESGKDTWGYHAAVFSFIFFAHVLWPTWLPWSLYRAERFEERKKPLKILFYLGLSVSLICFSQLLVSAPTAEVVGHSLSYTSFRWTNLMDSPLGLIGYGAPTLLPFFISSIRLAHITGVLMVLSLSVALVLQAETLTSVWCYFAGLISFVIALGVFKEKWVNVIPA